MSVNLNKVIIAGNLTRDPELKALPSGTTVANFGVASNRDVKRNETWEKVAEFHNCVAFGNQAEALAKYLTKGKPILVEGRLQTSS